MLLMTIEDTDDRKIAVMTNINTMAFILFALRQHERRAESEYDRREAGRAAEAVKEGIEVQLAKYKAGKLAG